MLPPLRSGSELRFSVVTSGSDSLSIRICRFGTSGLPTAYPFCHSCASGRFQHG